MEELKQHRAELVALSNKWDGWMTELQMAMEDMNDFDDEYEKEIADHNSQFLAIRQCKAEVDNLAGKVWMTIRAMEAPDAEA